ncbi:MAG: phosphate ABC transporter ATP-binding protein [Theionarchaea archaeon]|nr:MAG: phosphate ABC transporter ATP-binding protein [Theionarchaea archaeon DG-70]MBU7010756.1 phosphate ABC transporter ATP-binding protein [Theionarchaea archaeon]
MTDYIIETEDVNLWYDDNHALIDIDMQIQENKVTALIGPSGCGKSTLIRVFDRMNDIITGCRIEGKVFFKGKNIYDPDVDVIEIRKRIGMIFQKPNPFPMSVYDNVAYGPIIHGIRSRKDLDHIVRRSLESAALWDEVEERLDQSAIGLSGGQQQRLCIARALAIEPEVILMDEPTSALDPIATGKIEDLVTNLKKRYTVVIVTHNMQQAARISDYTGFMYLGRLIEFGETVQIFEKPSKELTENYITGRFG